MYDYFLNTSAHLHLVSPGNLTKLLVKIQTWGKANTFQAEDLMKQVGELNGGTQALTHWEERSNPSLISNTLPRETLHSKNASIYLGRKM